jgi:hypothetical protein
MEHPLVAISYAVDDEVREANLRFGPRRRFQSGPWPRSGSFGRH